MKVYIHTSRFLKHLQLIDLIYNIEIINEFYTVKSKQYFN